MKPSSLLKRTLCAVLCAATVFSAGCGEAPPAEEQPDYGTTTLMVYMVGSDLESKSSSASSDLEEMIASGIDLSKHNVVVCAGGSTKWENEAVSPDKLTTLHLDNGGFVVDRTEDAVSMGDSAPLAAFLNYAYEQYPADRHALILWDHGMGPVIGYGKDILFDDAALTLVEMRDALELSPFGGDNKLAFVGFDACLMASAELACVWDDYADYLVASQEVEPAFGWNYAFLSQMGKMDLPALTGHIAEEYMAACEAYFEEKGYGGREATLSCLDLSQTAAMEQALEALFAKAAPDVRLSFNDIAVKRVGTRALGRASTGSEYDLVDLLDMTAQLSALYPDEAAALRSAIDALVLHNVTNTEGCCGLSLYYPFFNKEYYKKEWSTTYTALGLFENYRQFLTSYADRWLSSDTDSVAQSVAPTTVDKDGTFTLTLSEEQAQSAAAAAFYVFEKSGEGQYHLLFASADVTRDGNTLTARFDGNIIYGKDFRGRYFIPLLIQRDTVGDIARYESVATFQNYAYFNKPSSSDGLYDTVNYHLAVNNKTGKVSVSAIVPDSDEALAGGKTEDVDLDKYYYAEFFQFPYYYPAYDENGHLRPLSEWTSAGLITGHEIFLADGVCFETAPLVSGEYYFMYKIGDVQGNEYCSELTPFTTDGVLPEPTPAPDPLEATWDSGDEGVVYDGNNLTVSLIKRRSYDGEKLVAKIENRNDFDVYVSAGDTFVNGAVATRSNVCTGLVPAGETVVDDSGIRFANVDDYIDINELKSLTFTLRLRNNNSGKTLLEDQVLTLHFTDNTNLDFYESDLVYKEYNTPFRGALAEEQTIYDKGGVTVTLLRLAQQDSENATSENSNAYFLVGNTSHKDVTVRMEGLSVGNVYLPSSMFSVTVPSGQSTYTTGHLSPGAFDDCMIDSINELALRVKVEQDEAVIGEKFCRVKLTSAADTAPSYAPSDKVVLDEQGITLTYLDHTEENGRHYWRFTVDNHSGKGAYFEIKSLLADDTVFDKAYDAGVSIDTDGIPSGHKSVLTIRYDPDPRFYDLDFTAKTLTLTLQRLDEERKELLGTFDTTLTLDVPS